MNQEIRFCTTSDGIRIAYSTMGSGPPLVKAANWLTHLEYDFESPVWRHLFRALAQNHTLIRYDERGTGLSDRDIDEISLDGWVRDLEAVVDDLALDHFDLLGISQGGPTAIQYAVAHPERVDRLVIYASFAHIGATDREAALHAGILAGWGQNNPAFRQVFTSLFIPGANEEQMRWFNDMERISASRTTAAAILTEINQLDVRPLLPSLATPTLVLHRRDDAAVTFERGRDLATRIPKARFIPLAGANHYVLEQEPDFLVFLEHVENFLGHSAALPGKRSRPPITILFTDLVGHTEMMRRLGDDRGREVLREHERITRDLLKEHGGIEIKTLGDGFMASFSSCSVAVDCAIGLQRAFAAHRGEPLQARVGLNVGEPIEEDGDLFGSTVIMASRIATKADAGEILIPEPLRHLLTGKSYVYANRGETMLKGFEDAVRLYEVRWRE